MSVLMKCIRYQKQFSENIIFNKNKRTSNLVTLYKNNSLCVMTRKIKSDREQYSKGRKIREETLLVRTLRKVQIEDILKSIETQDDIHTVEALILLRCCNKIFDCLPSERVKFGEYLWSHLSVCNVPLGVDHYNERLQIYLKNYYDFAPADFLQNMKENRILPNITTYEWCIEYYCRKGQINCIKILSDSLNNQTILKYTSVYSSLMWGYYQNGDKQAALQIFALMEDFQKNSETYTVLMCIYAAENEIEKVESIIRICYLQKIKLSNNNILRIIHTLAMKGHIKHIDKMILYLYKSSPFSSDDIHIVLQLVYSNQIDIVLKILSYIKDEMISQLCIQNLVLYSMDSFAISKMCNSLTNAELCKDSLLWALYYSYFRNDNLCLSLLKICSCIYQIKPHFFWPILIKKAEMYDIKGIFDILKIMVNDLNVTPCVTTISSYVLPYMTTSVRPLRELLLECGINHTIIDNAFVLMLLKESKTMNAAYYVSHYPGPYMYNQIAREIRKALFTVHDMSNLIDICTVLVEEKDSHVDTTSNKEEIKQMTHVPMDKQILDMIADYPEKKTVIKMIISHLAKRGIQISSNTVKTVSSALK